MQKAGNSKITKPKKEFAVKARKSVSSSIIEAGLKPGKTEMAPAAEISAALSDVTLEEKHHLISKAAYYRAERRSFIPGHDLDDWLNAETEIEMMLSKSGAGNPAKNA
jgi:hypothetical protein